MSVSHSHSNAKHFLQPDPALAPGSTHSGFVVEHVEYVDEVSGCVYLMHHEASGAKLAWIACDDINRTFAIAFKTPPADDTGVFHIIEHSVLCGSERFPVKEPFVNLLKSSMQTFLNALTYPDKTVYPVSSTNVQDLENLMDVYLDAVLNPAIYERPRIFEQEGWHYEIADEGAEPELIYNGVVFNEMKGALSDPDEVLFNALSNNLFPESPYRYESGGNPRAIPQLSYEQFLDAHARHYTLANSYTFLYGDLDIERELAFISERFDTAKDRGAGEPNPLPVQPPVVSELSRVEMATAPENACTALGYVSGLSPNQERSLACNILFDALMGSNEAPLKRMLLRENLADDIVCTTYDGIMQPLVVVELKGSKEGAAERFRQVFEDACATLVHEGIDHRVLEASLSRAEFNLREADYGFFTTGIARAVQMLHGWLYSNSAALDYLRYENVLATMKDQLEAGYFEQLLEEVVLKSTHTAAVELIPVMEGVADEEAKELAQIFSQMSEAEKDEIAREVKALRQEQEQPDTPEALASLPRLSVSDVGEAPTEPASEAVEAPFPLVRHDIPTKGISYIYNYFDLACVSFDELPYLGLLSELLGKLGTKEHSASELDILIEGNLGNLSLFVDMNTQHLKPQELAPKFVVGTSALSSKLKYAATLPSEIWSSTNFADKSRVLDILQQKRIAMEQGFLSSGHTAALSRASAGLSKSALANQQLSGVEFYYFLKDLLANFDTRFNEFTAKLNDLSARIFSADNLEASFTGTPEDLTSWLAELGSYGLSEHSSKKLLAIPEPKVAQEGFAMPGNVVYVGEVFDAAQLGCKPAGSWDVAARILSLDYLWNEVRVKGGAYGCGFRFTGSSLIQLYSYRDPGVDATLARYEQAGAWLKSWNPTEADFEGYLVSVVAGYDAPAKPRALARRKDARHFKHTPDTWPLQIRSEVLACRPDDVRALAPYIEKIAENHSLCVFGSAEIMKSAELELEITELMGQDS